MVESTRVKFPTNSPISVASPSSFPPPRISPTAANCCRNYDNFKRSALPVRFMYFNHDGRWTNFPAEVVASLKSAFLQHFDFKLNQSHSPKIDIEIRIDNGNSNNKRKREGFVLLLYKEEPEMSSSMKGDAMNRQRLEKWPNCCRLLSERGNCLCKAIRQWLVEAPLEKARFSAFEKQIEVTETAPDKGGLARAIYAWYGASVKDVESVLVHGFGLCSKVYGPDSYGVDVYLSPVGLPYISAKLAEVDENGEKHIVRCRLILGNVEQVKAASQQDRPSSRFFDTGADDTVNPKWYVVWPCNMSRHIIPVCVVSFKYSLQYLHDKCQLKGLSGTRYSLEKLISKMRNSLPLTKLREVETLCNTFRAGKLARDMLVKPMRLAAGDEVLLSTIKEIQAE
ncbi:conserved hypothetical protein [Ricinus communis]|uniref:Inactive poly [ADP-ribose] polymerase SRO3 n=1 Tax=Ricinus communis TaxID=3988 RepID=B9R6S2_RICCO|nr:conserved hypothetical protein [Ricinus communis]